MDAEERQKLVDENRALADKHRGAATVASMEALLLGPLEQELFRTLAAEVQARLEAGQLAKMWVMATAKAADQVEPEEVPAAALADILLQFASVASRVMRKQADDAKARQQHELGKVTAFERMADDLEKQEV